jgi:hypothetical protein
MNTLKIIIVASTPFAAFASAAAELMQLTTSN